MDLLRRRLPAILGLLAFVVLAPQYWAALRTPAIGIYHDDSIYLLTAKSLATGNGYRIPSTPGNIAQTKYPILYPAVLSLVWRLAPDFPANVHWLKSVSLLFVLGWLALSFILLKRWLDDPLVAVSLVAVIAACPNVIFLATSALSETQFACILTGCLLLLFKAEIQPSPALYLGAGLLAGGAYLTRSVGFVLILVPTLYLLGKRQWKHAFRYALPATLLAAGWLFWQVRNQHANLDPYLSASNYYTGYNVVINYSLVEKLNIVSLNVLHLVTSPYQLFLRLLPQAPGLAFSATFLILGACGFAHDRKRRILGWALIGNVVVLMLWAWPPQRFLVPWLTIVVAYVWLGVPVGARKYGLAFVWLIFACSTVSDMNHTLDARQSGFWYPAPVGAKDWAAFEEMARWARKNIEPEAVIQSNIDPTVYLFTGLKSVRGFSGNVAVGTYLGVKEPLGTPDQFRAGLIRANVRYLLVVKWSWFSECEYLERLQAELVRHYPGELQQIYAGPVPGFTVYRFSPGGIESKLRARDAREPVMPNLNLSTLKR